MASESVKAHIQSHIEHVAALVETLPEADVATDRAGESVLPDWLRHLLLGWKLLLAGAAFATAAAAAVLLALPPRYAAEALIAPTRARTQVLFEPRIKTVGADTSATESEAAAVSPTRLQALADLVASSALEARVIEQLTGQVAASELVPGELRERVTGSLRPKSEIVVIRVEAGSPADAVTIANTWAASYVDQVNRVYAEGVVGSGEALARERDAAFAQYQAAEAALATALERSPVEALGREIAERERRLALLLRLPRDDGGASAETRDDYRAAERCN